MIFIWIIIGIYLGTVTAKASVILSTQLVDLIVINKLIKLPVGSFVTLPLVTFYTYFTHQKKDKESAWSLAFAELLGAVIGGLFVISMYSYTQEYSLGNSEIVIAVLSFIIIATALLFLSVFDVLTLSIPATLVKYVFLFAAVINLLVALFRFISLQSGSDILWEHLPLGRLDNMITGVVFAGLIWLLVYVTKEKAMGAGDADIAGLIGIMLGWPESVSALFFTLFIGGIVALVYVAGLQKFKNVLIPFVPIMTLGFLTAIGFSHNFLDIVFYGQL